MNSVVASGEQIVNNNFFQRDMEVARVNDDGTSTPPSVEPLDFIAENARGPRRVQGDSGSVEQHSLADQIAAEKFLQSKKAMQGRNFPIRLFKIAPGDTT